ncbi:TolC family protein [Enterovibrio calviensis]|uniref:TolC family protein n=1 Tax=Enterovibrio calviensis TaxID=91359 RepID=UPI00054E680C|nr:TolC family protein [Enterovibrio calviensis]
MNIKPSLLALVISATVGVGAGVSAPAFAAAKEDAMRASNDSRTLTQLIETALANDASRKQFYAQSQAMREMGIASTTLMDPKLKVGVGGFPIDSFQFDKDPMTNISLGLMQQFERGDTLALQGKKANQQADGVQLQVEVRERDVANAITQLWLELGYQQQAERILHENQRLLRELTRFIQTNYSMGQNEAQDLLNAQLQVSKLDDKLNANAQVQRRIVSQLSEWLGANWLAGAHELEASNQLNWQALTDSSIQTQSTEHFSQLLQHPMVKMADVAITTQQTQVEIAEQAYAPQFGVEVMYGYRQANGMNGQPASDLVSAYLTLDIPLFTDNRQDRNLAAAQYQVGASKSQKDLLLAQMNAKVNALLVDKSNLEQRLSRYENTLLGQASARTKAVERGYQNNTAQFSDVIAAANDELTLSLEQQRLVTDLNLVNSNLAALLGGLNYNANTPDIAVPNLSSTSTSQTTTKQ